MERTIQLSPDNNLISTDSSCTITADSDYTTVAKSSMVLDGISNITITAPSSGSYHLASGWTNVNTLASDAISEATQTVKKLQEQVKSLQYGQDQAEKNIDCLSELAETLEGQITDINSQLMDIATSYIKLHSEINNIKAETDNLRNTLYNIIIQKCERMEKELREEKAKREEYNTDLNIDIKGFKFDMQLIKAQLGMLE